MVLGVGEAMRRREFITLGCLAHAGRALQPTMPTVGFLRSATPADVSHWAAAFRQGLKDAGFVEGAERRESNTAQRTTDGASVGSPLPRREP
jgi:hypothetical protein